MEPDRMSRSEDFSNEHHEKKKLPPDAVRRTLYLCGFLDLLGVSIIMPLIQPHIIEMGCSPTVAGMLGSVYGGLQLFSSPVIGNWSDISGRRYCLYICLFLSACGYTIIGIYSGLAVFFTGRVILGVFKHSHTLTKGLFVDGLSPTQQAEVMGRFNSFSSIGFIVGPVIGGHLAETDGGFSLVAITAGAVFFVNSAMVWWMVPPDSHLHHDAGENNSLSRSDTSTSLKKLGSDEVNFSFRTLTTSFREFDWPELWDLFLCKFLAGFSMIIFRTNFSMVLRNKFDVSPKTRGYITSYSGIIATVSGFLVGRITKRHPSMAQLFLYMTILQTITMLCMSFTPSIEVLILLLIPLGLVGQVSRVAGQTLTIQRSGSKGIGSVMGLSQSTMAIARIMAPFLAGLAQEVNVDGASYLGFMAASLSVALMWLRPQDPRSVKEKVS